MIEMLKQMCYSEFKNSAASEQTEKVEEQLSLSIGSLKSQSLKSQSQSTLSNCLVSKSQQQKQLGLKKCESKQIETKDNGLSENNVCVLHKKNLEIYCLTDRKKVCPHCALFGMHRQHELRPVKQVAANIRWCVEELEQTMERKQALDSKLKGADFRQAMIAKITAYKNTLITEIKQKFRLLQQNIKLAQKRAFDDVAKSFRIIAKKITVLDKEEHHNNLLYMKWEAACSQLLQNTSFDQKAYLMAVGSLNILKKGRELILNMQKKADSKIQTIQQIMQGIKIQENKSLPFSIFNYLNIVIQQQENVPKISEATQLLMKQQQQEIIEFNSVKIIKEVTSSLSHSRKRGHSSAQLTTGSTNSKSVGKKSLKLDLITPIELQNIISEFCNKQNLETLDLSNSYLLNSQIYEILDLVRSKKKIKSLKLGRNKLTTQGFTRILDMIPFVTNLNLTFNQLSEESVYELLRRRQKVPHLRIVNLSNNNINERRCQTAIEQLKKQGIIVTI